MVPKLLILVVAGTLAGLADAQRAVAAGASPESSEVISSASKSKPLDEVTVTATRVQLEQRVSKFVYQIADQENGGEAGLARWQTPPVCPLVSGLPREEGEYILGRVSEIARAAAVPIAGEQCRPNLYILVSPQPEELLRGMEKRDRRFTFGWDASSRSDTPAGLVDEFIRTPRPVRVWYNTDGYDAWGKHLQYCLKSAITCDGYYGVTAACTPPPPPDPTSVYLCGTGTAGGSHLTFNTVWTFSRVFVIVDQRRLQGVTRGQLADYVAMVGFGKLKPGANLGDASTILKLFDAAPATATPGMTDWDQAFLKSLYATEQISRQQRGEITRAMVREIVP